MASNQRSRIGKIIFAFSLLLGIAVVSSTAVQAQYPYGGYGQYGRNRGYNQGRDFYRYAQEQGFRDGLSAGEYDASRGHRFNPYGVHNYKKATNGYNSYYGNKDAYKQAYRDGFLRGYEQGYQRYNRGGFPRRRFPF